ncbi:MAG: DUF1850 domain-containing protein, partial [Nitriliruptoraceae bacterium]
MTILPGEAGAGATLRWLRQPRRRWFPVLLLLLTAGLSLLVLRGGSSPSIVLREGATGPVLFERAVEPGERVELHHTHSVTRRPVVEIFGVDTTPTLTLEGMLFDHPGPNLPTGPERFGDRLTSFTTVDGVYRVDHHAYPIGRVTILVGRPSVDHTLVFQDGTRVRFLDLTRAGAAIELEV